MEQGTRLLAPTPCFHKAPQSQRFAIGRSPLGVQLTWGDEVDYRLLNAAIDEIAYTCGNHCRANQELQPACATITGGHNAAPHLSPIWPTVAPQSADGSRAAAHTVP